jgi:CRP/FNR family cyclic AMP-dependent transcriptional regulator
MTLPPGTLTRFLAQTELCADFAPEAIATLAAWLEVLSVPEDEVLFEEGTLGSAFYVVLEGAVSIRRAMPTGPEHELALLHPGESFGEMALVDGAPRMASAVAETDVLLARLSRERFEERLQAGDAVATALLRSMSRTLCARQRELTWLLPEMVDFRDDQSTVGAAITQMLQQQVTWH